VRTSDRPACTDLPVIDQVVDGALPVGEVGEHDGETLREGLSRLGPALIVIDEIFGDSLVGKREIALTDDLDEDPANVGRVALCCQRHPHNYPEMRG
jgi:hypothetical protein